ncbi:hypothetical protein RUM44_011222 [Polyplax serrata]|uniref:Nucleolar protein 6 n=1 Tax=Polyplax serrata TaxID=468196 RepID=A0ABR1APE2_POLSC
MSDGEEGDAGVGYESDTGFSSNASSDEVVEELERNPGKRQHSSDEEDELGGRSEKKIRKESMYKKLHKPPTAEELNHLRETQNLFHSNLFRMQIEEMLKEIQIKEKTKVQFETWFGKFCKTLLSLKDSNMKYNLGDEEWLKQYKIRVPISQTPHSTNGTFQFKKPCQVSLIGSYAINLVVGPKIVADVLVEVPESFFQKEDFLNCRYHRKRALYLCELVHSLQAYPNLVENFSFVNEEIDNLKPKLEIIPFGKFKKHISVVLHVCPERGSFKLNRFLPSKSNVRKRWLLKEPDNEKEMWPTPFYNSTVAADLIIHDNILFLKETLLMHNNIKDGILLLKIWLHQRELDNSVGGFNGFLIALLVCYLLQIKKINVLMSSYQVFRVAFGCDWTKNGITLCKTTDDANIPTMTQFHAHHKVVFVDATGYHNLCYAMSPFMFKRIQHEAKLALDCLNNQNVNSFQALFIAKVPFYHHFDHMVIFNNIELLENIADSYSSKETQLNYCTVTSHMVQESIMNLLVKGLGNRIKLMCFMLPRTNRWKIDKKYKRSVTLTIGFNLDSNNYFSIIDKALETETETFREFWGEKSELRRFQDGTITEAVVWNGRTLAEKRLICKEIITYLLKNKFGLELRDYQYVASQLDSQIGQDVEEASLLVIEAFDQLMKQLRDLNDLPLEVVNVHGISPVFRYTDVFPPVPQKQRPMFQKRNGSSRSLIIEDLNSCPPWISPINVTIKMAASSKWPDDLEGIRRIRAAFNIKIAQSLSSQYGIISEPLQDRIELIKNGFVFRIRIVYPNEIALLKRTVDPNGMVMYKDTEKSMRKEKESVDLPKLSSALHGLYQEHNSFGSACCLVKRWISSHLLDSSHISEECIELLVASLYLRPQPHEPPCQPQVAFFRFLYLMATTNWNTECIVLNLNGELSREDISEIESMFNTKRQTLPPLFIATPNDRKKSVFTKNSPTPLILLRLIELCANALRIIEDRIYTTNLFDEKILFRPCLDSYDVIITVDDAFNPRKKIRPPQNQDHLSEYRQNIPISGFDPVALYLQELRDNYEEFALFFRDTYGGSVIALVWKPNALEGCEFKLPNMPGRIVNGKSKQLELNRNAILGDFWHLGKGLVKGMEVKMNGTFQKHYIFKENVE